MNDIYLPEWFDRVLACCVEALVITAGGKIIYMNGAAMRFAGNDLTGRPAGELLPPCVLAQNRAGGLVMTDINGTSVACVLCQAGEQKVFLLRPERGEPYATPLTAAEPSLRSSLNDIRMAMDAIEKAGAGRSNAMLRRSFHRLCRQLMNVFALSGAERDELPCVAAETDMGELCAAICETAGAFAKKRGVSLIYSPPEADCIALADGALTEQLMLNLVQNALQHVGAGGTVRLGLSVSEANVIVSVDDNGAGIAADELAGILQGWRGGAGTGVGLEAAREIARCQGGSVIIDGYNAGGVHVRVLLPRCQNSGFHSPKLPYTVSGESIMAGLSDWLTSENYLEWMDEK